MKVIAIVNLPFDVDPSKEDAYFVMRDGKYCQKVCLRSLPQKKVGDDFYERYGSWTPSDEKEVCYRVGFNDCLEEILGETE